MDLKWFIGKDTHNVISVLYSTSKGLLCKLVHVDVELLLSLEVAVRYVFVKMFGDVDKLHYNKKLANNHFDHTYKVIMCLVLSQIFLEVVAVKDDTTSVAIRPFPVGLSLLCRRRDLIDSSESTVQIMRRNSTAFRSLL